MNLLLALPLMTLLTRVDDNLALRVGPCFVTVKSGYAYSLNDDPYAPDDASPLTRFSQTAVDVLTPGGATVALTGGIPLDVF
jgi:hypothetical protein